MMQALLYSPTAYTFTTISTVFLPFPRPVLKCLPIGDGGNRLFACGDTSGTLIIYRYGDGDGDGGDKDLLAVVHKVQVHQSGINDMSVMAMDHPHRDDDVLVATASDDQAIGLVHFSVKVSNVPFPSVPSPSPSPSPSPIPTEWR